MAPRKTEEKVRVTAWVSEREKKLLEDAADSEHASLNYIMRLAFRQYLGLDDNQSRLLRVTTDTPPKDARVA